MHLEVFSNLDGVPIHYARAPVAAYGTPGKGPRTQRIEYTTLSQLNGWMGFLRAHTESHFGPVRAIVSAGAYVDKPGAHGKGRAYDIDSIWWKDTHLVANTYPENKMFYLGVEASLSIFFRTVLGYLYNRAHRDHWHVDSSPTDKFLPQSRSKTLFVQAAATHVWDWPLEIDGICGPKTQKFLAVTSILQHSHTEKKYYSRLYWQDWLRGTALRGLCLGKLL